MKLISCALIALTTIIIPTSKKACYGWMLVNSTEARFEHGMAFDPIQNRVITYGGTQTSLGGDVSFSTYKILDPQTMTWGPQLAPNNPNVAPRSEIGMVYSPLTQKIYVVGGNRKTGAGITALNDMWEITINNANNTASWVNRASAPLVVRSYASAWDPNTNRMVIVGNNPSSSTTMWYNPITDSWSIVNNSVRDLNNNPINVASGNILLSNTGQLVLLGCRDAAGAAINLLWFWDASSNVWTPYDPVSGQSYTGSGVTFSQAVWDNSNRVYVIQGYVNETQVCTFGNFNKNVQTIDLTSEVNFSTVLGTNVPEGRAKAAGVYIPSMDVFLIYGGQMLSVAGSCVRRFSGDTFIIDL